MKTSSHEKVARFSVSLPPRLQKQLDTMVRAKGYATRSMAVAEMIRGQIVDHYQQYGDQEIAGTITLVYDHHKPHLQEILTRMQHDYRECIISTLHVHLDHHNCLEVLVVRGRAQAIKTMAEHLTTAKGIKHGQLTITTTGRDLV
ncbi:MAG TPA: nickel-responsive transcriptional regulator NikR [Candidatus Paceibacterota bacterium]|nr:nickel-responsive transcriptional regulator NikR [Verrucomicrobiota bacterium]HRY48847.1 nickel-responsive transcriptional regulator NikR [Candidatus Paceibacterota bacterium]